MPDISAQRLRRIIWWSALYDLLLTLPFATPWTAQWMIEHLTSLHVLLGLSGALPPFAPLHLFFVNLFGTIVTLWAVLRLRDPQALYGLADSTGRFFFSAWMATYLWGYDASGLLALFLLPELIWGTVQFAAWWHARVEHRRMRPPMPATS